MLNVEFLGRVSHIKAMSMSFFFKDASNSSLLLLKQSAFVYKILICGSLIFLLRFLIFVFEVEIRFIVEEFSDIGLGLQELGSQTLGLGLGSFFFRAFSIFNFWCWFLMIIFPL